MGDDDRRAIGEESAQLLAQRGRDVDVQRRHRLVQQQQARIRRERAGDRDPLSLTAGELGGVAVGEFGEAHLLEMHLGPSTRLPARDALGPQWEHHVPERGEVREEHRVLAERGDATVVRRHPGPLVGQDPAVEGDRAGAGAQVPGDQRQCGRLPGAVRADDGEGLAVSDLEVELDVALGDGGAQHEAHALRLRCARAITAIATSISTKESATAASGSLSRCR